MTNEKNVIGRKFEFILLINGNIICQRYFNVKNFNPDVLRSYNLKECVDQCVNIITGEEQISIPNEATLKGKTWNYLWSTYNPYLDHYPLPERKEEEKEDIFNFQIKVDGRTVIERQFSGNHYPPKIRYDVDIRELIPEIIARIQATMSETNLTLIS